METWSLPISRWCFVQEEPFLGEQLLYSGHSVAFLEISVALTAWWIHDRTFRLPSKPTKALDNDTFCLAYTHMSQVRHVMFRLPETQNFNIPSSLPSLATIHQSRRSASVWASWHLFVWARFTLSNHTSMADSRNKSSHLLCFHRCLSKWIFAEISKQFIHKIFLI